MALLSELPLDGAWRLSPSRSTPRLIPFGWEYWGIEEIVYAGRMLSAMRTLRLHHVPEDDDFMHWLDAHLNAWADYWNAAREGEAPLRTRTFER